MGYYTMAKSNGKNGNGKVPGKQDKKQEYKLNHGRKLNQSFIDNMFKPGQSGNPSGRRKGTFSLEHILSDLARNTDKKTKKQVGVEVMEILLTKCKEGNLEAIKMLLDRIDGKALQRVQQEITSRPYEDIEDNELQSIISKLLERAGPPKISN